MRIGIVTTSFPRRPGDHRSPFIWEQARFLSKAGLKISVLGMHIPGTAVKDEWQGISIHRPKYLPERWEKLQQDRAGLPGSWNRSPGSILELLFFILTQFFACARLGRQVDILHAHWTLSGLISVLSSPIHKKPVVLTIHGSDIRLAKNNRFIYKVTHWVIQNADLVISVSKALKDQLSTWGITTKIIVIPDGVDSQNIKPLKTKREKLLLFVGSLTEQKGVLSLLEGFRMVHPDITGYKLVIIGDGPCEGQLRDEVSKSGLTNTVTMTGSISHPDAIKWMQRAHLLILPSIEEGFGVVLLEAMACGTPCMGVDSGGIPEIIQPECGILILDNHPQTIAHALRKFLSRPDRWQVYSDNSRIRIETQYDWRQITLIIKKQYEAVAGNVLNRAL